MKSKKGWSNRTIQHDFLTYAIFTKMIQYSHNLDSNSMEKIKQNIPLVVGLSLPIIMIILVTLSIYLPQLLSNAQPTVDFLYMTNNNNGCVSYSVQMGHLTRFENQQEYCKNWKAIPDQLAPTLMTEGESKQQNTPRMMTAPIPVVPEKDMTRLFVHNVKTNISKEVSFEEATKMNLSSNAISSDGFEVKQNYGNGGIITDIFGGGGYRDYEARYLVGHSKSIKLELMKNPEGNYYYNVQFLGWVMP